ncbi:MAG TPA: ABC transporter permease [Candidatus Nanopelagicales bacterium]|nr:ABC transporter permease [Candidatus Nanopelagicales bacterium]
MTAPVDTVAEVAAVPEEIQGRSLSAIAWGRFRHDKVGMVALVVLVILLLCAVFAPLICNLMGVDPLALNDTVLDKENGGVPLGCGLPDSGFFCGISWQHPFGVEPGTGRDLFARVLYGLRISLLIALSATFITTLLGSLFGIVSGYLGGLWDSAIGRLMDIILAFPFLLIILALSGVFTQRLEAMGVPEGNPARITYLILVLSIFGWPYLARIVRGQVLSIREREFVEASIAMGSGTGRILFKEILPNLWAPIMIYATLTLPTYIATEAVLSFLGVGVLPPTPTFGAILADSVNYMSIIPSYLLIPGTILAIVVVTFNLVGDSVRDALDPRAARA